MFANYPTAKIHRLILSQIINQVVPMFFHSELSPSNPQMFSSVLSQQFLQDKVSIKKKESENGILSFQAGGDWIIKGNIKEGDKEPFQS